MKYRDSRNRIPVRLCDLPLETRLRGAYVACEREPDPRERSKIMLYALVPSRTTYYIAA